MQLRGQAARFVNYAVVLAIEPLVGLVQHALDVLGMAHYLGSLFKGLLLVGLQIGVLQFLVLESQKVLVLAVALYLQLQVVQLFLGLAPFVVGLLIVGHLLLVACYYVHHVKLEVLLV